MMGGAVFLRRSMLTPGGVHDYMDENCTAPECSGSRKCPTCSRRTAGNKSESRRRLARQLKYESDSAIAARLAASAAEALKYDAEARAE